MNSRKIYEFERQFDATTRPAMLRRHKPFVAQWCDDAKTVYDVKETIEDVEGVVVEMPLARFKDLVELTGPHKGQFHELMDMERRWGPNWMRKIDNILYSSEEEERVRRNNPGVKAAWEQYQIMVKLSK